MTAPLPDTIEGVDAELARLARVRRLVTREKFPDVWARDQVRIDELLDWRTELELAATGRLA